MKCKQLLHLADLFMEIEKTIFFLLIPEAIYMWAREESQCNYFSFETAYSRDAKKRRRKGRSGHRRNFLEGNISENRMGRHT